MQNALRFLTASIGLFLLGAGVPAGPVYPPNQTAMQRRDTAIRAAYTQYINTAIATERQLIVDLEAASHRAISENNVPAEAEATDLKKAAEARVTKWNHPAADDAVSLEGRWHEHYFSGEAVLSITNGIAHTSLSKSATGRLTPDGDSFVIHWSNGYIDRITGVGSKTLLVEDWRASDATRFPDGIPTWYGKAEMEK